MGPVRLTNHTGMSLRLNCERRADTPTILHPTLCRAPPRLPTRHGPGELGEVGARLRLVPDPISSGADPTGAVSRGMRLLLARRDAEVAAGASVVGWKIGFNAPAVQQHFGLAGPVVGYLTDRGVSPDGATVAVSGWSAPAVEVEVAIRVGDRGEVAGLAPALELVDLDLPFDDLEAILAGNVFQRGVVFGPEVPGVDPWAVRVTVAKNGEVAAEGRLAEEPATTVAVVRSFLAAHGSALAPGDRIIAGSMVAPLAVAPGDGLEVGFGPLGALRVSFGS